MLVPIESASVIVWSFCRALIDHDQSESPCVASFFPDGLFPDETWIAQFVDQLYMVMYGPPMGIAYEHAGNREEPD